jgi:hypothetical protein
MVGWDIQDSKTKNLHYLLKIILLVLINKMEEVLDIDVPQLENIYDNIVDELLNILATSSKKNMSTLIMFLNAHYIDIPFNAFQVVAKHVKDFANDELIEVLKRKYHDNNIKLTMKSSPKNTIRVLGFDVGIKNLAFCIVTKSIKDKHFKIQEQVEDCWNIINLVDSNAKCSHGLSCSNPITKSCVINDKKYYFCTAHKKLHPTIVQNNHIEFKTIKKPKSDKCEHIESCKTKATYTYGSGQSRVFLCSKHKTVRENIIKKSEKLDKHKIFVDDFDIHELKLKLLQTLESKKNLFLNVDAICIENQPAFKNPTMKAISDVIYTWFMIRGIIETDNGATFNDLTFFAPSNKLKIREEKEKITDKIKKSGKKKYSTTKELAIVHCKKMIEHDEKYTKHLNLYKKMDDLCDAFLHCVFYIEKYTDEHSKAKNVRTKSILQNSVIDYDVYEK